MVSDPRILQDQYQSELARLKVERVGGAAGGSSPAVSVESNIEVHNSVVKVCSKESAVTKPEKKIFYNEDRGVLHLFKPLQSSCTTVREED